MVAEGVIYFVCVQWHVSNIRLFHSLAYHPPPAASVGSPPISPLAVMLRVIQLTVFVLAIAIFITCQLVALQACVYLLPFRWLPVRFG